eukprot:236085-Rhodomonas_salina.4
MVCAQAGGRRTLRCGRRSGMCGSSTSTCRARMFSRDPRSWPTSKHARLPTTPLASSLSASQFCRKTW